MDVFIQLVLWSFSLNDSILLVCQIMKYSNLPPAYKLSVEAFLIATMKPELNKEVKSFELQLFPKGVGYHLIMQIANLLNKAQRFQL